MPGPPKSRTASDKKRQRTSYQKKRREESVYIGNVIGEWKAVKEQIGVNNDENVAKSLIDCYREHEVRKRKIAIPRTTSSTSSDNNERDIVMSGVEALSSESDSIIPGPDVSSGMEEAHHTILRQHRKYIIDNVANPIDVVDGLFERYIFTESMKQDVEAEKTPIKQVRKILDLIPHRGPNAFDAFSYVLLETKNEWVVDRLRPGWKETQPNPDVGLPGERGRAIQQPAVDLPEEENTYGETAV